MATIQGIYLALFGRPADPAGLAFFNEATNDGADLTAIGDLASTTEYQARFTDMDNTEIVQSIYQSLFGRTAETEGVSFFVTELEAGRLNINNIAIAILDGAQGDDLAIVNAKLAAANLFTTHLDQQNEIDAYAGDAAAQIGREYIDSVTAIDPATADEADAAILRLLDPDGGQGPGEGEEPGSGSGDVVGPVFLSADAVNVDENTHAVVTVHAFDNASGLHIETPYAIIGGADAALFTIDAVTGDVSFIDAPDWENPIDIGGPDGDNVYELIVSATDGAGNVSTQNLAITVVDAPLNYDINVASTPDFTISNWTGDEHFNLTRTGFGSGEASLTYFEVSGTSASFNAAKTAVDLATIGSGISGNRDVVVAEYNNGSGGTNVLIALDNDGYNSLIPANAAASINDAYIVVENVGLADIDSSFFSIA